MLLCLSVFYVVCAFLMQARSFSEFFLSFYELEIFWKDFFLFLWWFLCFFGNLKDFRFMEWSFSGEGQCRESLWVQRLSILLWRLCVKNLKKKLIILHKSTTSYNNVFSRDLNPILYFFKLKFASNILLCKFNLKIINFHQRVDFLLELLKKF